MCAEAPPPDGHSVVVVIVTWNAAPTIGRCLASVPADVAVTVVDNASSDATRATVSAARPGATLVALPANAGFAAGVNRGIAASPPAAGYLLLNPDAALEPGALDELVRFARTHPRAAAVSALVTDDAGRPEPVAGGREPSLAAVAVDALGVGGILRRWSLYQPGGSRPERRDWVAGTAVLLRADALADVGPFDESFFLYCEDIDWCARARRSGWDIWIEPAAVVRHLRSAAVASAGPWVDAHRLGSIDRYFARTHGAVALGAFRWVRAVGFAARAGYFGLQSVAPGRQDLRRKAARRWSDAKSARKPPAAA